MKGCAANMRIRPAALDPGLPRPVTAGIRKQHRQRVARPDFDANVATARRKTEHEHDVRPLSKKLWQVAVDGGVGRGQHVRATLEVGQKRASPARKLLR
jgi:hypothetical protein